MKYPDSTWWTNVFFPTIENHQVVYALAWRNAGKKQSGNAEYYVPYPGAASHPISKECPATEKILFENGTKTKNIYK
ncbi:MAG: hypothetical protein WDM78_16315 [Puia sp.]